MLLFVLVFISFVIPPGITENVAGRYRIFSCRQDQFQCLNETCVSSFNECGSGQACVLPEYPENGTYRVPQILTPHPGQVFKSILLRLTCNQRFGVVESNGSVTVNGTHDIICVYGKWLPEKLPPCVRYCTLLSEPSVIHKCRIPGSQEFKPCGRHVPHGTTVDPQCRAPIYYTHRSLNFMNCRNGEWDYVAKCEAGWWRFVTWSDMIQDCGRVTPEGAGLVINGTTAERGELPWHAGIYTKLVSPYEQICGGSIVSNNVIISAAHCFWNDVETKISASKYAVAVGKLYRQWKSEYDKESQEFDVKEIMIPERFQGIGSTLQSDLAALILTDSIVFEDHIKPVCISFSKDFDRVQLQIGNNGKVAGWGLTAANGPRSNILKVVELPYIDYNKCVREVPRAFQQFITLDKFCAGYTTGTTVCRGDSGGGLAFATSDQYTERYYLRGVVSAAPTDDSKDCNDNNYAAFTRIADYDDFITEAMQGRSPGGPNRPNVVPCPPPQFRCDDGVCVAFKEYCKGIQKCVNGTEAACASENNSSTETPWVFAHLSDKIEGNLPNTDEDKDREEPVPIITKRDEVPWHVGVYDDDNALPICGGSIISPLTVITGGSCYKQRKDIQSVLLVAAGQTYRDINDARNVKDSTVQYSYVEALFTPPDDPEPKIAVLTLFRKLVYNPNVQPVTLNYDSDLESLTIRSTKLAGWNPDNGEITYTDLPYIRTEYCNNTLSPEDRETLNASICTGYFGSKQRALNFIGGGLVYKEIYKGSERYYLRGVMATAKSCSEEPNSCAFNFDSYIIFTQLNQHKKFLERSVNYVDINHYIENS